MKTQNCAALRHTVVGNGAKAAATGSYGTVRTLYCSRNAVVKEVRVPYGIAVQRRHLGFVSDRQAVIQLVTKRRCGPAAMGRNGKFTSEKIVQDITFRILSIQLDYITDSLRMKIFAITLRYSRYSVPEILATTRRIAWKSAVCVQFSYEPK